MPKTIEYAARAYLLAITWFGVMSLSAALLTIIASPVYADLGFAPALSGLLTMGLATAIATLVLLAVWGRFLRGRPMRLHAMRSNQAQTSRDPRELTAAMATDRLD